MGSRLVTYVALLRGINVGGNTLVSMAALKACCEALGLERVRTYIASGNVIFQSRSGKPRELESRIARAIEQEFGHAIAVVVRNLTEMRAIVAAIPRQWQKPADERRDVIFLRHTIDRPDVLNALVPQPGIEELTYHRGVLFWSAKRSGLARSTMLKAGRLPIAREMTARNVNTTRKLLELMEGAERGATS